MKELIDKMIEALYVNANQNILVFKHPDHEKTSYETYADCCSETWFADITGVNVLIGATVTAVENIDLPSTQDGRGRQEFDQFYGVKLTTNKGIVDIVFRNSSNGYYGGEIKLRKYAPKRGLIAITDDWSA